MAIRVMYAGQDVSLLVKETSIDLQDQLGQGAGVAAGSSGKASTLSFLLSGVGPVAGAVGAGTTPPASYKNFLSANQSNVEADTTGFATTVGTTTLSRDTTIPSSIMRGINSFGADAGSVFPGTYNVDYHYDTLQSHQFYASRGHKVIRLPFKWERLQPTRGDILDANELARLTQAVSNIQQAGMQAILDIHNYCRRVEGGVTLVMGTDFPASDLVDFWTRLSTVFNGNTGIYAYELMNEPHDLASIPTIITPVNTVYDFEAGIGGWKSDNGSTVAASTAAGTFHDGVASMSVTKALSGVGTGCQMRADDNAGSAGLTESGKDFLGYWLLIPTGTAVGNGWTAHVELYDSTFTPHAGPDKPIPVGVWTQVSGSWSSAIWTGHKNIGLQVNGPNVNATVTVYVDTVQQGTGTAGSTGAQVWETTSQSLVNAIRGNADNSLILVPGYGWQEIPYWTQNHAAGWITDSANNYLYSGHFYFDYSGGNASTYANNYTTENAAAVTAGYASLAARSTATVSSWVTWLKAAGVRGFISEIGWPGGSGTYAPDAANWNAVGDAIYSALDAAGIGATYWAGGEFWGYESYNNLAYSIASGVSNVGGPVSLVLAEASIIEAHPSYTPSSAGWEHLAALKAVCAGTNASEGFSATIPVTNYVAGQAYTGSVYLRSQYAVTVNLAFIRTDTGAVIGTSTSCALGASGWKRFAVSATMPNPLPGTGNIGLKVSINGTQAATFYADGLQIESGSSAQVWVVGQTPNAAKLVRYGEVQLFDTSNTCIFGGYAVILEDQTIKKTNYVKVQCVDYWQYLDTIIVNKVYTAQTDVFIIKDLLTSYATWLDQTLLPSAGSLTLSVENYQHFTLQKALQRIADKSGYNMWIDTTKHIRYTDPTKSPSAPFSLSDQPNFTTSFQCGVDDYTVDDSSAINRVYFYGGKSLSNDLTQDLSTQCNGANDLFVLAYYPHKSSDGHFHLKKNGTDVALGFVGGIGAANTLIRDGGTADALINIDSHTIQWSTDPTAGTTVVFIYRREIPLLVVIADNASFAFYGRYLDGVISDSSVFDQSTAVRRCQTLLFEQSFGFETLQIRTWRGGIQAGQIIRVDHTVRNIHKSFIVQTVHVIPKGNGYFEYTLTLGAWHLNLVDAVMQLARLATPEDTSQTESETTIAVTTTNQNIGMHLAATTSTRTMGMYYPRATPAGDGHDAYPGLFSI